MKCLGRPRRLFYTSKTAPSRGDMFMRTERWKAPAVFLFLCFFLSGAVLSPLAAEGLDVIVSGSWRFPLRDSFWSSPGPSVQSMPGSAALSVVNAGNTREQWGIEVKIQGVPLPEGVRLWVRRSGSGHGAGWIRSGLGFVPVGESPVLLFSGTGDRMRVPLQLRIGGITPRTPGATIRTSLIFTVVRTR